MKSIASLAAAAALTVVACSPVLACGSGEVLHADDFSNVDPAWGVADGATIADGTLTIVPEPDQGFVLHKSFGPYQDFDACVTVVQKSADPAASWASLVFWSANNDFYVFNVATNGEFAVAHRMGDEWKTEREWEKAADGVVHAGEEPNEIRVVGRGNTATLFINDEEVGTFSGKAPEGGGGIGVYARSPAGSSTTAIFDNLKVASPS